MNNRTKKYQRRAASVRYKLKAQKGRPRLSVYRSLRFIYAQIIDDQKGVTLVAASQKELDLKGKNKTDSAALVGEAIAKKAVAKNIKKVVFDRGPYAYAGRVKFLAQAARENGLEF